MSTCLVYIPAAAAHLSLSLSTSLITILCVHKGWNRSNYSEEREWKSTTTNTPNVGSQVCRAWGNVKEETIINYFLLSGTISNNRDGAEDILFQITFLHQVKTISRVNYMVINAQSSINVIFKSQSTRGLQYSKSSNSDKFGRKIQTTKI